MKFLFIISLSLLIYTYIGYPVVSCLLAAIMRRDVKKEDYQPSVSMIVAAYNEEKVIADKIENCKGLNYPGDFNVLIGSDCSTDRTDEIVKQHESTFVRLVRLPERGGKTALQNFVAPKATGEIIVFSDATSLYDKNAITLLVRNFADKSIGCVGGRLVFRGKNTSLLKSKNIIENFDQFLKQNESRIHSIFGVDGCIYAIRKKLLIQIDSSLTSDFVMPLQIVKQGYRSVFEPEATCYEDVENTGKGEFLRKIRTVRAGIFGFFNTVELIDLFCSPLFAFGLISHKLLRWLSPYFLIALFMSNMFLMGTFTYNLLFLMQVLFYLAAYLFRASKQKIFRIPTHFCMLNLAAVCGWYEFLKGRNSETWDTGR